MFHQKKIPKHLLLIKLLKRKVYKKFSFNSYLFLTEIVKPKATPEKPPVMEDSEDDLNSSNDSIKNKNSEFPPTKAIKVVMVTMVTKC